ncbi:hypothetical protein [uncultured Methanobrevibacter sp.]|uniref:hypothetical protein n=1 Tax=uncultured Methanobrevibacter sp. TaxID=253161 RepID=UPI0025EF1493|nr:hypothetical protein [uncultured Methanobrevibacter sp.]MCI6994433.1 hypothetical protein [Methanobrevibacter sp.]
MKLFEKDGEDFVRFEYKDNGRGLKDENEFITSKSLGWQIIGSLSGQMDGEYEIINENGFGFILTFPIR